MCVMSMVMDHYQPLIPDKIVIPGVPWIHPGGGTFTPDVGAPSMPLSLKAEIDEMRALIAEFREAVAAAKRIDVLTKHPDCVDPEKGKLEARVAELERQIEAIRSAFAPAR